MTNNEEKINDLLSQLEAFLKKQEELSGDIFNLKIELIKLKSEVLQTKEQPLEKLQETDTTVTPEVSQLSVKEEIQHVLPNEETVVEDLKPLSEIDQIFKRITSRTAEETIEYNRQKQASANESNFEKIIGENIINKIGIAITVIGVGIGAKYSIENDLISPLTRIILGYLCGLGLLTFGYRLKNQYENYSAVLVSGAMAVLYFITYFAFDLYHLIPQILAFALMVIFTIFTVLASLKYDRQVIAFLGLTGAYLVPFLLSNGSGNAFILFSYMTILNIGILAIAMKKYWKPLMISSFAFTWLIYLSWYSFNYVSEKHFIPALAFGFTFFIIFYSTILAYKLSQNQSFGKVDVALLLLNSFIFFGVGYSILDGHVVGKHLLGMFTLINAIVHFAVSAIIYHKKLGDKNLYYFILGLVLVFITIAIPVQLDGNWVSLMWAGEAALLFWLGVTKKVIFYEKLSYVLILLAFISMLQDWETIDLLYSSKKTLASITPFLNVNFFTSLMCIVAFGFITLLDFKRRGSADEKVTYDFYSVIVFLILAVFLFTLYYAIRFEIELYWDQLFEESIQKGYNGNGQVNHYAIGNTDYENYKIVWILNYSLFFISLLTLINIIKIKARQLAVVNFILSMVILLTFLVQGLYALSELRESYINPAVSGLLQGNDFNLWFRYVSFAFVAFLFFANYNLLHSGLLQIKNKSLFQLFVHLCIIWVVSSELIHWLDILGSKSSYKLGLSILWGVYALLLIVLGIWKKNRPIRIFAIVLFGITLLKLFLFDISHLTTISKTIVFLSLGILLLVISFLYNKYTNTISGDED